MKQLLSTNDPENTRVLTENYPATNMKQAGFTVDELLALHYDLKQIALAGYTAVEFKRSYPAMKQLLGANVSENTRVLTENHTAEEMREAGFTVDELLALHYDLKQIALAGYTAVELKRSNIKVSPENHTAEEMREAGFTDDELHALGYDDNDTRSTPGMSC